MHVAIMGSGAIGGYIGARLAANGTEVSFIARGDTLRAMKENGLKIVSEMGDLHIELKNITSNPEDIGPVDIILFSVKGYDTESAAEACKPMLSPKTGLVTLQNGVESVKRIAAILGANHTLGGSIFMSSAIENPGVIRHFGKSTRLLFGEPTGEDSDRAKAFQKELTSAGIQAEVSRDIERDLWMKFLTIAAWSGVSAVTRSSFGVVCGIPESRQLFMDAFNEVVAVAQGKGIKISREQADASLTVMLNKLPGSAKASMLQDIEKDKRLELPWLSGAVVRLGRQAGVPTPTHEFIVRSLVPYMSRWKDSKS